MGEPCVEDEEGLSPALGGPSSHKASDGPGALGWGILAMGLPDPTLAGVGRACGIGDRALLLWQLPFSE